MVKEKEMLFYDFPPVGRITERVREQNKQRSFTGGIRIGKGMYRTDEQERKYREDSWKKELP